jgi:hypothetical protein
VKRRNAVTLSGTLLILFSASLLIASAQGTPTVDWWVIAGGGAPSSGGGGSVSLNDTLGQPVIGSATGSGGVALVDGYWPGAGQAAPLGVTDLRASRAVTVTVVQLDWTAVTKNEYGEGITATYNVYRALDQPYFNPVTAHHSGIPGLTDTDSGVIGDTTHSYYYVIRAFKDGAASATSNRVGVFSFPLVPGS